MEIEVTVASVDAIPTPTEVTLPGGKTMTVDVPMHVAQFIGPHGTFKHAQEEPFEFEAGDALIFTVSKKG